ncbi:MAG: type II toxin-antitoxin system RatA family toxin [Hydrotalea sp.]|nr:type II toxin-antitoxin system RatA family toxin [Hydrotalea sp.]MDI9314476.1 type II toxin-antitoxin system RatA family toxin [Hydrotalea sp.]
MAKKFYHQEKKIVPFSDQHLYAIVKDVAHYPDFLPWCLSARIVEQRDGFFVADLVVGVKSLREEFRSEVTYNDADKKITTRGTSRGPLSTMDSHWHFRKINDQECEIDFSVSLSFSSFITEKLFSPFFNEAVKRMTAAFLTRAKTL